MLQEVRSKFVDLFAVTPRLFCSPGRINIIGEHTDYNNGYVLPAAITMNLYFAVAPNTCRSFRFYAYNLDESVVLSGVERSNTHLWANYLLGVIVQMQKHGAQIPTVDVVFGGDLPWGAGLSSSAALECGFAFALNEIFSLGFSKIELVKMSQLAEHEYVGLKCGIMDQYAVMFGKKNSVIQLDCKTLNAKYFPFDLKGYSLVLCNSGVKHELASSEYNVRRKECEIGVAVVAQHYDGIRTLRDVTKEQLHACESEMSSVVYTRCRYVIDENERVQQMCEALLAGNVKRVGELLYAGHEGMSKCYEASCVEIDEMISIARSCPAVLGSRIMGGGFGGSTISVVADDGIDEFSHKLKKEYYSKYNKPVSIVKVAIGDGTRELV